MTSTASTVTAELETVTDQTLESHLASSRPKYKATFDLLTKLIATDIEAGRITRLDDITPAHVQAVLAAAGKRGGSPSSSLLNSRRSHLRDLFKTARRLGMATGDPTLDVAVPSRTTGAVPQRPVTPGELEAVREAARRMGAGHRDTAATALAWSGAWISEIAALTADRFHLDDPAGAWVDIPDSQPYNGRSLPLDDDAVALLRPLLLRVVDDQGPDALVFVQTRNANSAMAAVGQMVRAVLDAAGLRDTPGLVAGSLTRSAGVRMYQATRDLKYVAQLLGKRSRKAAATCIGLDDPVKRPDAGGVMRPDAAA